MNIRSLLSEGKLDEIKCYVEEENIDVVGITETWLNEEVLDSEISMSGFRLFRKDRKSVDKKRGGGVALYIKESIPVVLNERLIRKDIEGIWCDLYGSKNVYITVGVVYRPPLVSEQYTKNMIEQFKSAIINKTVIMGDLNYPNIDWLNMISDKSGEVLVDFIQDNFLTQHVDKPTRDKNFLDVILATEEEIINRVEVREPILTSDHCNIFFNIELMTKQNKKNCEYKNFNKADYGNIIKFLRNQDWDRIFENCDAEQMWNRLKYEINFAINRWVPIGYRKVKQKPKWFSKKLQSMRQAKLKLWKRYRDTGSYNDYEAYRKLNNLVVANIRKEKIEYEKKLVDNIKQNSKNFFKYVQSKSKVKVAITTIKKSAGHVVTEEKEICTMFNNFFLSVFTKETDEIEEAVKQSFEAKFRPEEMEQIVDCKIQEEDVIKEIKNLKADKAAGPDDIPQNFYIQTADVIAKPLVILYRFCLDNSEVPSDWRDANVTPIFKKGQKEEVSNYRPVSLTCVVCKVLEKIIQCTVIQHLNKFKLINNTQHGFTTGLSCGTNLLEFHNYAGMNVDEGNSVDVIFLDFQKAFDKVPHKRLLFKVRAMGISGKIYEWIKKWLEGRRQRVVFNGEKSEWVEVSSGVPQGSVLGPLLFLIYIDDIDHDINSKILKFADDTKIFKVIKSVEDSKILQEDLNKIQAWSQHWLMPFNIDKCKVMHTGRNNSNVKYNMNGHELQVVTEEVDLGVIMQSNLKWNKQCLSKVNTANRILGMIKRTFKCRSRKIILPLYKTLVRPHLDYCVCIWRPHLQRDISLIEKVQRRATKLVSDVAGDCYEERLKELKLTTMETRRIRGDLIQVFRMIKGIDKVDTKSFFTINKSTLRGHSVKLYKNRFHTDLGKYLFRNRVVTEWNGLNDDIISSTCVNSFKNKLDRYLKICRGYI